MTKGKYLRTDEHRRNMSLVKKGTKSHRKGLKLEKEYGERANQIRAKIRKNHADVSGSNNPAWSDCLKTVRGIHVRFIATYGAANKCESITCNKKSNVYDWSHKTHIYSLRKGEWQQLCRSCHKIYDHKQSINGVGKISKNHMCAK